MNDEYLDTHRNSKQLFHVTISPATFKKLYKFEVLFDCDWDVMPHRKQTLRRYILSPFQDVGMEAAGCIA